MGIFQLEDVAFDLEPRDVIEAAPVQLIEYAAAQLTGAERHGPAVGEIEVAKQPAAVRRPRYYLEAERIRHQEQIGRALHLRHVEAAATGEDGKDGAVRSIFREQASGAVQPLRNAPSSSAATRVLPRSTPCWSGNDSRTTPSVAACRATSTAARRCSSDHRAWRSTKPVMVPAGQPPKGSPSAGDCRSGANSLAMPRSGRCHRQRPGRASAAPRHKRALAPHRLPDCL